MMQKFGVTTGGGGGGSTSPTRFDFGASYDETSSGSDKKQSQTSSQSSHGSQISNASNKFAKFMFGNMKPTDIHAKVMRKSVNGGGSLGIDVQLQVIAGGAATRKTLSAGLSYPAVIGDFSQYRGPEWKLQKIGQETNHVIKMKPNHETF